MLEKPLEFLQAIAENNRREWYHENKDFYQQAHKEFESFIEKLIDGIRRFDPEIGYPTTGECIFRIYRDTRFSRDKTPYKTWMSAYIAKGGRKSPMAGYYFHLEPEGKGDFGGPILACGMHCPESDVLRQLRTDIYENFEEFEQILQEPYLKKHLRFFDSQMLKKTPQGFPKNWEHAHWLRYKEYSAYQRMTEKDLAKKTLLEDTLYAFEKMQPLNRFMNFSLETVRENRI